MIEMTKTEMKVGLAQIAMDGNLTEWAQEKTNQVALEINKRYPELDNEMVGMMAKQMVKEVVSEIAYAN